MTRVLFLVFMIAAALLVTTMSAHSNYQCTYEGQLYSEGAEVTMDGETRECICNDGGDRCQWY